MSDHTDDPVVQSTGESGQGDQGIEMLEEYLRGDRARHTGEHLQTGAERVVEQVQTYPDSYRDYFGTQFASEQLNSYDDTAPLFGDVGAGTSHARGGDQEPWAVAQIDFASFTPVGSTGVGRTPGSQHAAPSSTPRTAEPEPIIELQLAMPRTAEPEPMIGIQLATPRTAEPEPIIRSQQAAPSATPTNLGSSPTVSP